VGPEVVLDLELAHGRCVGVRIPPDGAGVAALAEAALLTDERAFGETLAPVRRRTWVAGRAALREALARAGLACPSPVLADDRGAPRLPASVRGSISHKETIAVALVAPDGGARVGVDIEIDQARRHDISRRVLTAGERDEIAGLSERDRAREVLVRFSAKEAIYKALDPFVRRFVGFDEVQVSPLAGGSARVVSALRSGEGPFAIDVSWRRFDGLVLTTARVAVSPSGTS
jgi:enterobactin synthetase component D